MGKANRVLLMLIAMVVIMITAVGINRAVEQRSTKQWAKERRERYEEARAEVAEIQMTISELSQDPQALLKVPTDGIRRKNPCAAGWDKQLRINPAYTRPLEYGPV